jgi:hypothetical protein
MRSYPNELEHWKLKFGSNCSGGHRSCEQIGMEQIVPSLHHRKEGWLRHQKISRSYQSRRSRGGFPFYFHSKNHPGLAISGCFAMFS